jgi:hypothetical protein
MTCSRPAVRRSLSLCLIVAVAGVTAGLSGCDRNVNSSKTTTTKTQSTPEGTKKTTETTEKKTVTEPKNNP